MQKQSRLSGLRGLAALLLVLTAMGLDACSSGGGKSSSALAKATTIAPSVTTTVLGGDPSVTSNGTLRPSDLHTRQLQLNAGDAIRAVFHIDDGFQAQIILFGPDPTSLYSSVDFQSYISDTTTYMTSVDGGMGLSSSLPATPLVSSTNQTGGCKGWPDNWLVFVAPIAGTYWLGVEQIPDQKGSGPASAAYTVRYQVQPYHSSAAGGHAFDPSAPQTLTDAEYVAAESADVTSWFVDATFFPPGKFVGTQYGCDIPADHGPGAMLRTKRDWPGVLPFPRFFGQNLTTTTPTSG